jgi:prepilin-type N-terminal cleavage/methylation domain-containing protein
MGVLTVIRRLDPRAFRTADDGFTLIELIVSMAIVGVIILALGSALTVSIANSNSESDNLTASHHADLAASYFEKDVASSSGGITTSGTACNSSSGALVTFRWPDPATGITPLTRVSYSLVGQKLSRISCGAATATLVLADNVTSAAVSCLQSGAPTPCSGSPTTATLNVTQVATTNQWSTTPVTFSLTGALPQTSGLKGGSPVPPPLLILSTGSDALHLQGNASLCVKSGLAVINSTSASGMSLQGSADYDCGGPAPAVNMPGGGCSGGSSCPTVNTLSSAVDDPYKSLPDPVGAGKCANPQPATAPNSLTITNSGVYCYSSGSLSSITNTGSKPMMVFLYGSASIDTKPSLAIVPCDSGFLCGSGAYKGMALWLAHSSPSTAQPNTDNTQSINLQQGNGSITTTGIVYAPTADMSGNGNSSLVAGQLIVNSIGKGGTPTITIG